MVNDRKYESPSRELIEKASTSAHEVYPGLVIGSISQCGEATKRGYTTICVRHQRCFVPHCEFAPVLNLDTWVASTKEMERFSDILHNLWYDNGKKVYVHCFHGIERAPLAVAYALKRDYTPPSMSFEEVYSFVRKMRPVAQDRTLWLEKVPA